MHGERRTRLGRQTGRDRDRGRRFIGCFSSAGIGRRRSTGTGRGRGFGRRRRKDALVAAEFNDLVAFDAFRGRLLLFGHALAQILGRHFRAQILNRVLNGLFYALAIDRLRIHEQKGVLHRGFFDAQIQRLWVITGLKEIQRENRTEGRKMTCNFGHVCWHRNEWIR